MAIWSDDMHRFQREAIRIGRIPSVYVMCESRAMGYWGNLPEFFSTFYDGCLSMSKRQDTFESERVFYAEVVRIFGKPI
jgi:hypothetical protein